MGEVFGIAAFRSRQQVLRMEDTLRRFGVATQIINTPRSVAIGCGLSVRFAEEALPQAQQVIRQQRPAGLIGLYRVDARGVRPTVQLWTQ